MLVLNAGEVRAALPMVDAIEAARRAFRAWSSGEAVVPQRLHLEIPGTDAVGLTMPAYVGAKESIGHRAAFVVKAVSVFPGNRASGLPVVQGAILVLDPETGACLGLLDGAELTAIRTGAATGLATDLLARRDAKTLVLFGAGGQAITQVQGVCAVRTLETLYIVARREEGYRAFCARYAEVEGARLQPILARDAREALREADVICTATRSTEALFEDADLKPGVHINAIGAFTPGMQEIPVQTVARSRLFVDNRAAALTEAGDIVRALRSGSITDVHIAGELGELAAGRVVGRQRADQVTLFKSVGMAAQDATAAAAALSRAEMMGIGQHVAWDKGRGGG